VDTDVYPAHIHFPFFATGPDGVHVIEKGTPIAQVIPFRREDPKAEIGVERLEETDGRQKAFRNTIAGAGWYRRLASIRR
jgi:antitoxin (DNA-binding transcriptional repressor) of toxin-antitoxin stability system